MGEIHFIDATHAVNGREAPTIVDKVLADHGARLTRRRIGENQGQGVVAEWIEFPDGTRAEWYGPTEDKNGAMANPGAGSVTTMCRFFYDLAARTHWVITVPSDVGIFIRAKESADVPIVFDDFPDTTVVGSAGELEVTLNHS